MTSIKLPAFKWMSRTELGNLYVSEAELRARDLEVARVVLEAAAKVCDVTPPYPFRPSIGAAWAIRALEITHHD